MPRQSLRAFARGYYVLASLILGGGAINSIWGTLSSFSDGCQLVFSQSDLVEPPSTGPIPGGLPACQQYVSILPIALALAGCIVLLVAAIRFGQADGWSRSVVGVGALVGIGVSALPMAGIWWVSDYYNNAPPEVLGLVIGTLPLLVGLGAAWVTWRVHGKGRASAQPAPA